MSKSTQQKPVKRIVVLCDNKGRALVRAQSEFTKHTIKIDHSKAMVTMETPDTVNEYWMVTVIQEIRGLRYHEYLDWRDDMFLDFVKMRAVPFQPNLMVGDWPS